MVEREELEEIAGIGAPYGLDSVPIQAQLGTPPPGDREPIINPVEAKSQPGQLYEIVLELKGVPPDPYAMMNRVRSKLESRGIRVPAIFMSDGNLYVDVVGSPFLFITIIVLILGVLLIGVISFLIFLIRIPTWALGIGTILAAAGIGYALFQLITRAGPKVVERAPEMVKRLR